MTSPSSEVPAAEAGVPRPRLSREDRLTEIERAASRRLAVFPGAFTAQAASAVCVDEAIDPSAEGDRWLGVLSELADKRALERLIRFDGEERYRQSDALRRSELRHLRRAGEWDAVHERLVSWLMELAEPYASPVGPAHGSREKVGRNRDAFLAGIQWALARGDNRASLLATSLAQSWWDSGRTAPARDLLAAVTSSFDQPHAWSGVVAGQAAWFGFHTGDYDQALVFAEQCAQTERPDRTVRSGQALALAGWCHLERGEVIAGQVRCAQSREVLESLNQPDQRMALLPDVIQSLILLGDLDEAALLLRRDWAETRAVGHPASARKSFLTGQIALSRSDPDRAGVAFTDALRHNLRRPSSAWLLTGLALTASMRGDHRQTLLWAAAARARCLVMGVRPGQWWRGQFAIAVARAQSVLSPEYQSAARTAGEEI